MRTISPEEKAAAPPPADSIASMERPVDVVPPRKQNGRTPSGASVEAAPSSTVDPAATPAADAATAGTTSNGTASAGAAPADAATAAEAQAAGGKPAEATADADAKTTGAKADAAAAETTADADAKAADGAETGAKPVDEAKAGADLKAGGKATAEEKTADDKAAEADSVSLTKKKADRGEEWRKFAPPPERVPGRYAKLGARVWAFVAHEWTLAVLGSFLAAAVMTWPTLKNPTKTLPMDLGDPTLQAWQMAWSGHELPRNPLNVWNSNTFYPESNSFAFSDTLMGYFPVGMIGSGFTAAILRYNIMFVFAFALAFLGVYALVRQLGGTKSGAALAAAAFGFAPWRWTQAGHLHVLSSGGIALSLAMLARGHGYSFRHGYRPEKANWKWVVAGWAVATWQISLGFGIGLPFAYALALLGVIVVGHWALVPRIRSSWWADRKPFARVLLIANLGGGLLFALIGGLMARPYLQVVEDHPNARRVVEEVSVYSPPKWGWLVAPVQSRLWGEEHAGVRALLSVPGEMSIFLGYTALGLAAAGLIFSVWSWRIRAMLAAGTFVSGILAMGTAAPKGGDWSYLILYDILPGWDGIRTPGRLVLWTTLCVAVLAAGAVSAFAERVKEFAEDRVPYRPGLILRTAMVLPMVLALAEGAAIIPQPEMPKAPLAMKDLEAPFFILPSDQINDENYMLWGTDGLKPMVNGGSGFTPIGQQHMRDVCTSFPNPECVEVLREAKVKTLVIIRSRAIGGPYELAASPEAMEAAADLGIVSEERGDVVIYKL
ncbi:hypothetical protein [Virgisporangium aliadipatigenens]|uniref:hypothetical protein n=1 Tax=Virgisporangium aliadipatigenens TaxID=741659 RepID=UPI00194443B8|nr:hypothetical protein [Virgisporangium aliadipatigenens]